MTDGCWCSAPAPERCWEVAWLIENWYRVRGSLAQAVNWSQALISRWDWGEVGTTCGLFLMCLQH